MIADQVNAVPFELRDWDIQRRTDLPAYSPDEREYPAHLR